MALSDELQRLLQERGATVSTVARDIAVERSLLAQIVSGSRTPNEVLTRKLAGYFGQDPDEWAGLVAGADGGSSLRPSTTSRADGFVEVGKAGDFPIGQMRHVLEGRAVVANVGGRLWAFANTCPHAGASLGDGTLAEFVVQCPWHAGRWDIRTGEGLSVVASRPVQVFEIRVVEDRVQLKQA